MRPTTVIIGQVTSKNPTKVKVKGEHQLEDYTRESKRANRSIPELLLPVRSAYALGNHQRRGLTMRNTVQSVVLALSVPLVGMSAAAAGVDVTKLLPADGESSAEFGFAVALDGETAAIGARSDSDVNGTAGSVYIFKREGGTWSEQDKLLAADGAPLDQFGHAVALDGNTLVVGAPADDDNGFQSGSAYVFKQVGGVWTQQAKLLPSDGVEGDEFGRSVAVDGDTAVVGGYADGSGQVGRAYVFVRTGSVWSQQTKLAPFDGSPADVFGGSVAVEGDKVAIGAWGDDDNGLQSGSVYVYTRGGGGWPLQTKLQPSDANAGAAFGSALAMDGDLLVVGANKDDDHGHWSGSAYVFRRVGGGWTEEAKLLPSDGNLDELFGESVAVHGSSAVVGAMWDDDNGEFAGSAYVYGRVEGEWTERFELLPADIGEEARFGAAVALSGHTALVGAWGDDDNGLNSGSAYAYDLPPLPPDVPAVGGFGAALLMLAILGGGAWFLRRRC
jgi:hypothetical protein